LERVKPDTAQKPALAVMDMHMPGRMIANPPYKKISASSFPSHASLDQNPKG